MAVGLGEQYSWYFLFLCHGWSVNFSTYQILQ